MVATPVEEVVVDGENTKVLFKDGRVLKFKTREEYRNWYNKNNWMVDNLLVKKGLVRKGLN